MSNLWILDPGHGGVIDGDPQTPGNRSPRWSDGSQLIEGEFTRDVVHRLAILLEWAGIEHKVLVHEQEDISLGARVRRANAWGTRAVYVSIHANESVHESANGYEVFTSPGETASDRIATRFLEAFAQVFPEARQRTDESDGDPDKEANFYVLRKTRMSAILTESFFMTNEHECKKYLMTRQGRQLIATAHYVAIQRIETEEV